MDAPVSMRRFDVELFVNHPTLAPAEITRALGLEPSHSHGVGEQRRTPKRELPGVYRDTHWRYNRRFEAGDQWFHAQVAEFVAALAPHRQFLEKVRSSGGSTTLILQFLGDGYHGDNISHATLEAINLLGLDIGIEVYADPQSPNTHDR